MLRWFVTLLLVAQCNPLFAQVYRWEAPDGSIIFSDEPPEKGATPMELEPLQTYTAPTKPSATQPTPSASTPANTPQAAFKYTAFSITQPSNDEGLRSNNGQVSVQIKVLPGLNSEEGHQLVILLDGKQAAGPAAATAFTLENVERGSHSLVAEIRDKSGNSVKTSSPVTFHLLRTQTGGGR